ncbi:trypsin-like serine protease [Sulfitobacter sp. HNIBRBA3233]|uniref:trypsin-like serine peptidase n=1 Tax=Sulfitobacter marinivivus TaxID=3158558 RepID=UPI0032DFD1E5
MLAALATPAVADSPLVGLDRLEGATPWRAVGRLDIGTSGFCTGTLIAPDLVLTAAHCTVDGEGRPRDASSLRFRAGFRSGHTAAERDVVQIARPAAYDPADANYMTRISNDVALLRLAEPIATHVISPFNVEPLPARDGEVSVVSYGRGRESLPSIQRVCQIVDQFQGVMAMDCDTTFGSSGAPVFRRDGTLFRIVSIVSGGADINGTERTVGMALPDRVAELKETMRAARAGPTPAVRRIGVGNRGAGGAKFLRPGGS